VNNRDPPFVGEQLDRLARLKGPLSRMLTTLAMLTFW
jgi:hypothetical protein